MSSADIFDVIIVGYGPIGQAVSVLLAQQGWRVAVLEKRQSRFPMPRAVSFDGESGRILAAVGIAEELGVVGESSRDYVWQTANGRVLFEIDVNETGRSGWPDSTSVYQPKLEESIAIRAARLANLTLLRGHNVVKIDRSENEVRVGIETAEGERTQLTSRWVIGCDGANSFVRQSIESSVQDFEYFNDWLTCDGIVRDERSFTPNNLQICDPARPRTAVSAGPGHRRWEFMRLPGESRQEFGDIENVWRMLELFGIAPADLTLERHAVYTFQARYVHEWRCGRVLLAGDAAHLMPPFAGQGMCSGFRDAANIAWKLDLILRGVASEALLDSYGMERRNHVRHAIEMSMHLGKIICETDAKAAEDRNEVMIAVRERTLGEQQAEPAVRSLDSGVLSHRTDSNVGIGTLAPQGRVTSGVLTGLFDEIVGYGFVLIVKGDESVHLSQRQLRFLKAIDAIVARVRTADETITSEIVSGVPGLSRFVNVIDNDHAYLDLLSRNNAVATLIRPDFYVFGFASDSTQIGALVEELENQVLASPEL